MWKTLSAFCAIVLIAAHAVAQVGVQLTYKSASSGAQYDIVKLSSATPDSVVKTTVELDTDIVGTLYAAATQNTLAKIYLRGSFAKVNVVGAVDVGDRLVSSSTAGKARASADALENVFSFATATTAVVSGGVVNALLIAIEGDSASGAFTDLIVSNDCEIGGDLEVTGGVTAGSFIGPLTGTASVASTVTIADAAGDTTTFPMLAPSATGNLGPLTDAGIAYNATTNALTVGLINASGGTITGITDLAVADGGTGASDASNARTNLGLGSIATQASSSVSITGGSITGITDLPVADGGTGSSTAANARTALGVAIGTNVQAYDADLDALSSASYSGSGAFVRASGATFSNDLTVTKNASASLSPTFTNYGLNIRNTYNVAGGTQASPTAWSNTANILTYEFYPYNGSTFYLAAQMNMGVDGSYSSGWDGRIGFTVDASSGGGYTEIFVIKKTGVEVTGTLKIGSTTSTATGVSILGAANAAAATAILSNMVGDSGSGGTKGLVPAPATGDATKFLRGDGTWVTNGSGAGDVVGPSSATDNAIARFDSTTGKLVQDSSATVSDAGLLQTDNIITTGSIQSGSSGNTGSIIIYPATAAKGRATITKENNTSSDTATIMQFDNQSGARTYHIPDAGGNAYFTMTEGTQTINGTKTFGTTPIAPTAAAGTNTTALATTAFVTTASNYGTYQTVFRAAGIFGAARTADTFLPTWGGNVVSVISGGTTSGVIALFDLYTADYPSVNGLSPKLRMRGMVNCNDTAPASDISVGLYPITRPGTSGGVNSLIYTIGTVVSGSTVTFTTPAGDAQISAASSDFSFPSDGQYALCFSNSSTTAALSFTQIQGQLQIHYN